MEQNVLQFNNSTGTLITNLKGQLIVITGLTLSQQSLLSKRRNLSKLVNSKR